MPERGLPPASYATLVDVDPPLADHVLRILDEIGVPAYAEPLAGETGPYREVRAPDRPTTRVYVDRARLAEARGVIEQRLPALRADFHADAAARTDAADMRRASEAEIDAAWADIVAGFTAESPPAPDDATPTGSGLSARLVREHTPEPGPRDYVVEDDPGDERYVPPPPPPLPAPRDRFDGFAWAGVIIGPILVIISFLTGTGGLLAGIGFVAFTAGFVTLIARSGDRRRDDDDNGAVV